jgi:hypothetical protein
MTEPTAPQPSQWQSMKTAPTTRPILLAAKWASRTVWIVGVYQSIHGAWVTQPIWGQGEQIIHADAWAEIPAFH